MVEAQGIDLNNNSKTPIRIGILHSLSGTMAISERPLKDTLLMLIEEQNRRGGLLERPLEAIVVNPASDWLLFAEKARELIEIGKVDVIFGCWTSASRKAVLPIIEEQNNLLFYPVQYEGEEASPNIIYTGATPNQQAIPAVDFFIKLGIQRWILAGTDYIYPRTINKIIQLYLARQGVAEEDIMLSYTPFGFKNWQSIVADMKTFAAEGLAQNGKKTAVISTINGDANISFYEELTRQAIKSDTLPVMAFSIGEQELSHMDATHLVGHYAAWNYFMSIDSPNNTRFISDWRRYNDDAHSVTNDPMEAHHLGFQFWVDAVKRAGSTDTKLVKQTLLELSVDNLSGSQSRVLPNHHITKPTYVGKIGTDGQFSIVWRSVGQIPGDAYSDYLPKSQHFIADWRSPINCGRYDQSTLQCVEQKP